MDKKIIIILQPFASQQQVYVYEGDNKIDMDEPTLGGLENCIANLILTHKITKINLAGPRQFARGIAQDLEDKIRTLNIGYEIEMNLI